MTALPSEGGTTKVESEGGGRIGSGFMAGLNVTGADVRGRPERVVEILKPTPIRWLRIHSLPTRALEEKGPNGVSYLDGIEHLCKNGFNIVAPIEVGYESNVGPIQFADIDRFVEQAYEVSLDPSRKIASVAQRYGAGLVWGIENEIDMKTCLLQSLPGIGWRSHFETWARQAVDPPLKYARLNNILKAVKAADPAAKTMTNVVAEDARVFFGDFRRRLGKHAARLKEHSISLEEISDDVIDWKSELRYLNEHLNVDYVGLDTYANWILKYPIYGKETGGKVEEAAALVGRPVFNPEFGYTTYRNIAERAAFSLFRRPSASLMQLEFFQNTLRSIEGSPSIGTFPWVMITHPDKEANPRQEAYFGLFKMRGEEMTKEPAFDYYVEWLRRVTGQPPPS
jgi:hypothetical protein